MSAVLPPPAAEPAELGQPKPNGELDKADPSLGQPKLGDGLDQADPPLGQKLQPNGGLSSPPGGLGQPPPTGTTVGKALQVYNKVWSSSHWFAALCVDDDGFSLDRHCQRSCTRSSGFSRVGVDDGCS